MYPGCVLDEAMMQQWPEKISSWVVKKLKFLIFKTRYLSQPLQRTLTIPELDWKLNLTGKLKAELNTSKKQIYLLHFEKVYFTEIFDSLDW